MLREMARKSRKTVKGKRERQEKRRLEAAALFESGVNRARVARELGVRADILRNWKRQAEGRAGLQGPDGSSLDEHITKDEELRRLRRENELLRQERDFLKKAAAYFAKESP